MRWLFTPDVDDVATVQQAVEQGRGRDLFAAPMDFGFSKVTGTPRNLGWAWRRALEWVISMLETATTGRESVTTPHPCDGEPLTVPG